MKTLTLAAVTTLIFTAIPAYADSEVSPTESQLPTQVAPAPPSNTPGYLYSTGTNVPVYLYNTQQRQGTWLFPPNPSAK